MNFIFLYPLWFWAGDLGLITNSHFIMNSNLQSLQAKSAIILGCPSRYDGSPTRIQLSRIEIAEKIHNAYPIEKWVTTGGAVRNTRVEAEDFKMFMVKRGFVETSILTEPKARDTIENLKYSFPIIQSQGYESTLIITNFLHQIHTWRILNRFFPKLKKEIFFIRNVGTVIRVEFLSQ
ncbi:MAG: YdcF family protein [Bdellovibrionales bacterium]|nr:YdcF family protein [Bdellovibrionales bacterium]